MWSKTDMLANQKTLRFFEHHNQLLPLNIILMTSSFRRHSPMLGSSTDSQVPSRKTLNPPPLTNQKRKLHHRPRLHIPLARFTLHLLAEHKPPLNPDLLKPSPP